MKNTSNKFHTEFGIIANSAYIIKELYQYSPCVLLLMLLGIINSSVMTYLSSYIGKYIIEIANLAESQPNYNMKSLILLVSYICIFKFVCITCHFYLESKRCFHFTNLRNNLITQRIKKIISLKYHEVEKTKVQDMYQKACDATGSNEDGIEGMMHIFYHVCIQIITIALTFVSIVLLDYKLILILSIISVVQYVFFQHIGKKDKREVWDKLTATNRKIKYYEHIMQDFDYAKDIRLYNIEKFISSKYHQVLTEKQKKSHYSNKLWLYNSLFSHFTTLIASASTYFIIINGIYSFKLSIGDFTFFIGLALAFSNALTNLLCSLGKLKICSMQTDDFRSFINYHEDDLNNLRHIPKNNNTVIEFRNVSFKHDGSTEFILKNINLVINANDSLAIVGLNGSGKTTFIKLLIGLYEPTEGTIFLNGVNIKEYNYYEYLNLFSPVFQDYEVFAFSICENISMKPINLTNLLYAEKCAIKAGLETKIYALPNGINTDLFKVFHKNGVDLSGGEKQKLAISRALYKNAQIFIFDEPTSALDAIAEYALYKEYRSMLPEKASIFISHRLSSTRFFNNIVLLDKGEIIECGNHNYLLSIGGKYSEMFNAQASYYL